MPRAPFTVSYRFLELLAKQIFEDSPVIAVRELIQNAHDAVLMRAAREKGANHAGWGVHIELFPNEKQKQISVLDTGIGMTPKDITESLTRLGEGEKTEARRAEWESSPNPEMLKNVAGTFGMGFIAAAIISRKIEIWTKTADGPPVYCSFSRNEEGFYEEGRSDPDRTPKIGTRVLLHIGPDQGEIRDEVLPSVKGGNILHAQTVEKIAEKYCDLLEFEVAISTGGAGKVSFVNRRKAPWEEGPRPAKQDLLTFFKRRFGESANDPLDYIQFEFTRDIHGVEAAGVLYIPKPSFRATIQDGPLDIFVKRIWICDNDLDILPPWARFLNGVIVSPDLAVRIDRRHLDRHDTGYHKLAVAFRDHLRKHFVEMARKNQNDLLAFLDEHGTRFEKGLLEARVDYEGSRPAWFTDLVRILPFRVYSRQAPGGYRASLNDLLNVLPADPITVDEQGKKRQLYGVDRVLLPEQQSEFRQVIADKSYPIIVPESDLEWYRLNAIGREFEDVLQIANVEATFVRDFVQPISDEERNRWALLIQYVQDMLRYGGDDQVSLNVNAGAVPQTKLPIFIHWKPRDSSSLESDEGESGEAKKARFHQITTINTGHELMSDLLKFTEDSRLRKIERGSLAADCLLTSYHLALLEQDAGLCQHTFQDILQHNVTMMKNAITHEREIDALKTARDNLQGELSARAAEEQRLQALIEGQGLDQGIKVPSVPERRDCAVVFVDIVGSTAILMGIDQADRGPLFSLYARELLTVARNCEGFFDKFTGDGAIVLFGVADDEDPRVICRRAQKFAASVKSLTHDFGDRPGVREALAGILAKNSPAAGLFQCRIACSYGRIAFGDFGGRASAVGRPVVQAARICSDKDLYPDGSGIVITRDVYGALSAPGDYYEIHGDYEPNGLEGFAIALYAPGSSPRKRKA